MKRFNKILCVIDPDKTSDTAIATSLAIANDYQSDIVFMSVMKPAGLWQKAFSTKEDYTKLIDELVEQKRSLIAKKLSTLAPDLQPTIVVNTGIGFIQIIKRVIGNEHDLVVKCAQDVDWMDRMLGSEDMHLLRKCPCPLLMLKPGQADSFKNILATVDVNDDSNESDNLRVQEQLNKLVLEYSATISIPELSELHIGSAWEAYAEDFYRHGAFSRVPNEEVDQYVEQVRRECSARLDNFVKEMSGILGKDAVQYLEPKVHLVKGKASREIPLMVEKYGIDLIVMGTVGRVGIPGLIIGNTAELILEQAKCSIFAIKPDGFKTPVG